MADRVRQEWTGTGTGTMTLGAAVSGFQAFPAGFNGEMVSYLIQHTGDGDVEVGKGVYTHSTTSLTRAEVRFSTNSNSLVNFTAGTKHVSFVPLFEDLVKTTGPTDFNGHTVSGGIFLAAVSTDNTGRTLALADAYSRIIECSNATGQTFTIPANVTVAFPIGTVIGFLQLGSGAVTIDAAGSVTLEIPDGLTAVTRGENHTAFIRKRTTNTWHIAGGLADAS